MVLVDVSRLAAKADADERGPFVMLTDDTVTVWLRPGAGGDAVLGARRLLDAAARLCRELEG